MGTFKSVLVISDDQLPQGCQVHALTVRGDERGSLIALEAGRDVPFDIARVYYVFGTQPGVARGFHAHVALQQFAVVVSGACTMVLDDGHRRVDVRLDRPDRGLSIPPMVWHEMQEFTLDCVLLVFADALYDETDYIRDYERFLALICS